MDTGEQGPVEPCKAPVKTPMLEAINIIQWCLYYPGVLDPDELELTTAEREALADSLAAYKSGDLLEAVAKYPAQRAAASDAERVYRAAILLSVGQVEQAQTLTSQSETNTARAERSARLAASLREVIAVVKNQRTLVRATAPALATEWLAESYYLQSQARLAEALPAAPAAAAETPKVVFSLARV